MGYTRKGVFTLTLQMRKAEALNGATANSKLQQVRGRTKPIKTGPRLLSEALTSPLTIQISPSGLSPYILYYLKRK